MHRIGSHGISTLRPILGSISKARKSTGEIPLSSNLIAHSEARLTDSDRKNLEQRIVSQVGPNGRPDNNRRRKVKEAICPGRPAYEAKLV